jgi:hypothetical protein
MTDNNDKSLRKEMLEEADSLVNGDRNNTYGPPHQDFQRTADALTAFGFTVEGKPLSAHHVAMILATVKLSRLVWTPGKRDSWVDLAGYAACGFEAYELTKDEVPEPEDEAGLNPDTVYTFDGPEPPPAVKRLKLINRNEEVSKYRLHRGTDGLWIWLHPSFSDGWDGKGAFLWNASVRGDTGPDYRMVNDPEEM